MHAAQILDLVAPATSYMALQTAEFACAVAIGILSHDCIINMVEGALYEKLEAQVEHSLC